MSYSQQRGRRPFERASKIAHTEVINHPLVQSFVRDSELPAPPDDDLLQACLVSVPDVAHSVSRVVAIDGGMTQAVVRPEFPSATVTFFSMGPLLLRLSDLNDLERMPFIGPEDMRRLNEIQRYNLVLPTHVVRTKGELTFSAGVRRRIQQFLQEADRHLIRALRWLFFREWLPKSDRQPWSVPRCPNPDCDGPSIEFTWSDNDEKPCPHCGRPVFVSDGLRLYERIDDELGAGGITSYVLTAIEQIILVRIIKELLEQKSSALESVLEQVVFVKDGPLAFFGTTAPLYRPMRELMLHLGSRRDRPLLNLVGVEKSGPFVEHAALIESRIPPGHALLPSNEYIYKYITPGDPSSSKMFGHNTYYGRKIIYRDRHDGTYVLTLPCGDYDSASFQLGDLYNASRVLSIVSKLRCSMYDNALVPVVLANKLVSLADAPSSEILAKFVQDGIGRS